MTTNFRKSQSNYRDFPLVYLLTPRVIFESQPIQSPHRGSIERFFYLSSIQKEHVQSFLINNRNTSDISSFPSIGPQLVKANRKENKKSVATHQENDIIKHKLGDFFSDSETNQSHESNSAFRSINDPANLKNLKVVFAKADFKTEGEVELPQIDLFQTLEVSLQMQVQQIVKRNKEYSCKYCGDIFPSGCGLGGHIAKVHQIIKKRKIRKYKTDNQIPSQKDVVLNIDSLSHVTQSIEPSSECFN
jgi:hypothetical protein